MISHNAAAVNAVNSVVMLYSGGLGPVVAVDSGAPVRGAGDQIPLVCCRLPTYSGRMQSGSFCLRGPQFCRRSGGGLMGGTWHLTGYHSGVSTTVRCFNREKRRRWTWLNAGCGRLTRLRLVALVVLLVRRTGHWGGAGGRRLPAIFYDVALISNCLVLSTMFSIACATTAGDA